MSKIEFTIKEPVASIGKKIRTAFVFTVYLAIFYYTVTKNNGITFNLIILGFVVFNYMILPAITTKVTYLNFSQKKIRYSKLIGPFEIKQKWKYLVNLKYISVFKTENGYEVNLWLNRNEIINLFVYDNFEEVMKKAFFFAEKLEVDLLDARKRGYHKWVNKTVFKTTGEIEYED